MERKVKARTLWTPTSCGATTSKVSGCMLFLAVLAASWMFVREWTEQNGLFFPFFGLNVFVS